VKHAGTGRNKPDRSLDWSFFYPKALEAGHFTATLLETTSRLTGSTSEIWSRHPRAGETVLASLSGSRTGYAIQFTKTYEGPEKPNHSVQYEGTLNEDQLEIEGRWFIPGNWSGRFLMIRAGGRAVEQAQEEFERLYL
jgi:hypothetical protein